MKVRSALFRPILPKKLPWIASGLSANKWYKLDDSTMGEVIQYLTSTVASKTLYVCRLLYNNHDLLNLTNVFSHFVPASGK